MLKRHAYTRSSHSRIISARILDGGHNFGTIRGKDTWFELLRPYTRTRVTLNPLCIRGSRSCGFSILLPRLLPRLPLRLPRRLPLLARPQKCLIATRVCATVYRPFGMRWNRVSFSLSLSFSPRTASFLVVLLGLPPLRLERGRKTARHKNLYARCVLYTWMYGQTCPLNDKLHACICVPFSLLGARARVRTYHPPLRFFYPGSDIQ